MEPLSALRPSVVSFPEDAVEEAWVELIQLDKLPPSPIAWLFRADRWRAMNVARSEQRRAKHQRCWSAEQTPWLDDVAEMGIDAREAEKLLRELDEMDREIVIARIWGELSFEQIAELVHVSTSSAHRRYGQALQRLEMLIQGTVRQVSPPHES